MSTLNSLPVSPLCASLSVLHDLILIRCSYRNPEVREAEIAFAYEHWIETTRQRNEMILKCLSGKYPHSVHTMTSLVAGLSPGSCTVRALDATCPSPSAISSRPVWEAAASSSPSPGARSPSRAWEMSASPIPSPRAKSPEPGLRWASSVPQSPEPVSTEIVQDGDH